MAAASAAALVLPQFSRCCRRRNVQQERLFILLCYRYRPPFYTPHALLPASSLSTAQSAPLSAASVPDTLFSAGISSHFGYPRATFLRGGMKKAFTTSASSQSSPPPRFTNTKASFDWSDDEGSDDKDAKKQTSLSEKKPVDKATLPPPYDPFSKKPVVEEPKDPKDLQEIFHKMRTEGLNNYAIKMFDGLSKDGLTHEALALFAQIKDNGTMPDVVAHTAVIEAYANAGGHSKEALKTYERMLASGVNPNQYTYSVLIKGLAGDGKLKEARKYILEMVGKGMKPNGATYTEVFEAYVKEDKTDDARALLAEMQDAGFKPDEKAVREHLGKRGHVFRSLMSLLFGK